MRADTYPATVSYRQQDDRLAIAHHVYACQRDTSADMGS